MSSFKPQLKKIYKKISKFNFTQEPLCNMSGSHCKYHLTKCAVVNKGGMKPKENVGRTRKR